MREQAVFRIDPVNDRSQLSDRARSSPPLGSKVRRKGLQPRRRKRFPLQPLQDLRKEKESFGVASDPVNDRLRSLLQGAQKNSVDSEKDQRGPIGPAREVVEDGRRGTKRENNRDNSPRRLRQNSLAFGPAHERFRIEPRAQIFSGHREILAQVEFVVAEFVDQDLALEDGLSRRRGAQPARQLVFSHRQARGGKQFEEPASPKKVEVLGIYMRLFTKSIPGLPSSRPAGFDTRNTLAIKLRGRFRASSGAVDKFVINGERRIDA